MRHRYFSESLRLIYGISAKASLLQKPTAVNDRPGVVSTPERGAQYSGTVLGCQSTINNFQM